MTCAAKRGSQLSNGLSSAIRTLVLFSGNSESSTLSFHFSHSDFHTTIGHVINIAFQNDSAKTKIFDENHKK